MLQKEWLPWSRPLPPDQSRHMSAGTLATTSQSPDAKSPISLCENFKMNINRQQQYEFVHYTFNLAIRLLTSSKATQISYHSTTLLTYTVYVASVKWLTISDCWLTFMLHLPTYEPLTFIHKLILWSDHFNGQGLLLPVERSGLVQRRERSPPAVLAAWNPTSRIRSQPDESPLKTWFALKIEIRTSVKMWPNKMRTEH